MDVAKFRELLGRAKRLRKEYEESSTAFLRGKRSREAFVELGAEALSRSEWGIPKKVTRAFGSSASIDWRSSEQFKKLNDDTEQLVREADEAIQSLKGRQPSLRKVHEAVMPDTKLKHLAGVLATAERYAKASGQKKRKRFPKRESPPGTKGVREEHEEGWKLSHVQTLMTIGVTAILGLAALGFGIGLEFPVAILSTIAGTLIILVLTDEMLRRASLPKRKTKSDSLSRGSGVNRTEPEARVKVIGLKEFNIDAVESRLNLLLDPEIPSVKTRKDLWEAMRNEFPSLGRREPSSRDVEILLEVIDLAIRDADIPTYREVCIDTLSMISSTPSQLVKQRIRKDARLIASLNVGEDWGFRGDILRILRNIATDKESLVRMLIRQSIDEWNDDEFRHLEGSIEFEELENKSKMYNDLLRLRSSLEVEGEDAKANRVKTLLQRLQRHLV